jgi:hypothetical protein
VIANFAVPKFVNRMIAIANFIIAILKITTIVTRKIRNL